MAAVGRASVARPTSPSSEASVSSSASQSTPCLFEAVVEEDYDAIVKLYASNARNSILSYLSMRRRWSNLQQAQDSYKSEEKLDEFLQQLSYPDSHFRRLSPLSAARQEDDTSYYYLLKELGTILASLEESSTKQLSTGNNQRKQRQHHSECLPPFNNQNNNNKNSINNNNNNNVIPQTPGQQSSVSMNNANEGSLGISKEADRLVWEASSIFSDSRPPSNFVVYDRKGSSTPPTGKESTPPIFDGSVANATPPPLGGTPSGAFSGGAGTILHLVCAMDRPLILAFLLCMGADACSSHTAFRRLMVHEAACNGSIQCLTLLLEMGHKFAQAADAMQSNQSHRRKEPPIPFFPDTLGDRDALAAATYNPPIPMNFRGHFRRTGAFLPKEDKANKMDFLSLIRQFQGCYCLVKQGKLTQLEAARSLLSNAWLVDATRASLIRSCSFSRAENFASRSFVRHQGFADGHGNTPLHWAAFKNEVECVSLLLKYHADANARAHPSGWTPLHDAAYSDSSESIELLINEGAMVDARANSGATPLCFAAQEDAADAAQLLLDRGADLSARCAGGPTREDSNSPTPQLQPSHPHSRFSGYTPLHYCAHYNAHRAARILLKHESAKIAMETPDLSDRLPIHVAVARGSSDVLRELLHAGARIDIRPGSSPTSSVSSNVAMAPNNNSNFARSPFANSNEFLAAAATQRAVPPTPIRRPPTPERLLTPHASVAAASTAARSPGTPVSSPILRSMIPSQPITSSKPWNCLSQQAIDECRDLISKAEQSWSPDRHLLFTPRDRRAVMELLRVGKRLEQQGTGIFLELWPLVLNFCGRGWFEKGSEEDSSPNQKLPAKLMLDTTAANGSNGGSGMDHYNEEEDDSDADYLALPHLSSPPFS